MDTSVVPRKTHKTTPYFADFALPFLKCNNISLPNKHIKSNVLLNHLSPIIKLGFFFVYIKQNLWVVTKFTASLYSALCT